jgi:mono/diheme cytochrome c family protein
MKINVMHARRFAIILVGSLGAMAAMPLWAAEVGASMNGPVTFPQQDGPALFQAICQGCHMPDAQGAAGAGAYPALANNKKLVSASYPILTVLKGRKSMPSFANYLSDAQIAAVVGYVRTHFGNHYADAVTADMVKAAR